MTIHDVTRCNDNILIFMFVKYYNIMSKVIRVVLNCNYLNVAEIIP